MRRRLLTIAIFLLAGAVVNVAVAWGCAFWLEELFDGAEETGWQAHPDTNLQWKIGRWYKPGIVVVSSRAWCHESELEGTSHALLPRYWGLRHRFSPYGSFFYFVGMGWGWPCKALWYDYEADLNDATGTPASITLPANARPPDGLVVLLERVIIKNAVPLSSKIAWLPRGLPLRFIVPGFLINTLFYAAILWLLIPGPFMLRRFIRRLIRRRRGLCPGCGYPVGESDVCTECGRTLPGRASVTT